MFILLSVAALPVFVIYVEGASPPLRSFVYFAPMAALILAAGLDGFGLRLLPKGRVRTLFFPVGISIYILVVMYFEVGKIDTILKNDIQNGTKSQNLYAQYYSDRYYPLKSVKQLKRLMVEDNLPTLISGCEPHGVPNYFRALGVPYHRDDELDTLLSKNDSIFIMTNHPSPFLNLSEYHVRMVNRSLNYHNILMFSKSAAGYAANEDLERLHEMYGDSVGFVLNVFSEGPYADFAKSADCYFVSDSTNVHLGDLMDFTANKPYICYFDMTGTGSNTLTAIVSDRRREINLPIAAEMPTVYFGKLPDTINTSK